MDIGVDSCRFDVDVDHTNLFICMHALLANVMPRIAMVGLCRVPDLLPGCWRGQSIGGDGDCEYAAVLV